MNLWKRSLPFRAVESLSCKAHARLLDRAFNDRLNKRERFLLRFHGRLCAPCRRYDAQSSLVEALRRELWSEDNRELGALSAEGRQRIARELEREVAS